MVLRIGHDSWGGKTLLSLTTILVAQDPASAGLALSACWRRFAERSAVLAGRSTAAGGYPPVA
jgi:hypothetical protein